MKHTIRVSRPGFNILVGGLGKLTPYNYDTLNGLCRDITSTYLNTSIDANVTVERDGKYHAVFVVSASENLDHKNLVVYKPDKTIRRIIDAGFNITDQGYSYNQEAELYDHASEIKPRGNGDSQ
jgi:hypothetical protein